MTNRPEAPQPLKTGDAILDRMIEIAREATAQAARESRAFWIAQGSPDGKPFKLPRDTN
ncbi:hypothetical protein K2Q08_00325 [Patescibacteria group bacterium]|nr:hypothetical protein [Patescibacteria group bacterium]